MDFKPVHLTVTSHPENLKQIRNLIKFVAQQIHLSEDETSSLILAVDEACSNIIRHGYNNDYTRQMDLTITPSPEQLIIQIIDDGISFDISAAMPRDPEVIKPGGLGIFIIKQVMDLVEYGTTDEGRNKIKLIKKL